MKSHQTPGVGVCRFPWICCFSFSLMQLCRNPWCCYLCCVSYLECRPFCPGVCFSGKGFPHGLKAAASVRITKCLNVITACPTLSQFLSVDCKHPVPGSSGLLLCCYEKHSNKSNLGGKGFSLRLKVCRGRIQGKNLKQKP